jgi:hypothetical protein
VNPSINTNAGSKRHSGLDPFILSLLAGLATPGLFGTEPKPDPKKEPLLTDSEAKGMLTLMEATLQRMIALDADLEPEEVQMRYDPQGEGLEHPYAGYEDWRDAVADEETTLGYWAWIVEQLNGHRERLQGCGHCEACQEQAQAQPEPFAG